MTVEGGFTAEHMAEGHRQPCARGISTTTRCALRTLFLSKFLSLPFVNSQRVVDLIARWFLASCARTRWNPDHELSTKICHALMIGSFETLYLNCLYKLFQYSAALAEFSC